MECGHNSHAIDTYLLDIPTKDDSKSNECILNVHTTVVTYLLCKRILDHILKHSQRRNFTRTTSTTPAATTNILNNRGHSMSLVEHHI